MDSETISTLSLCFLFCVLYTVFNWYKFSAFKARKEKAKTSAVPDNEELQFATGKCKQYLRFSILMTAFSVLTFVAVFMFLLEVA